jgi:deoxyribose-phosphate aldolase
LRTYLVFEQWLPQVASGLAGTGVLVGSGINFPMGADCPAAKAKAVEDVLSKGATTIDFSMNWRALMSGRVDQVREELRLFSSLAAEVERKTIIEVCFLSDDKIRQACDLAVEAGLHWVKTSTGQFQGPNMEQVAIVLDQLRGSGTGCKVSGVKFPRAQNAYAFLLAGVEIIGSQGVVEIIEGLEKLRALGVLPAHQE